MISRKAAEAKGAEYLAELIFFYGFLFGLAIYEYRRSLRYYYMR